MNETKLKSEMMSLWKDTFHDSDDYIRLIFDNYFNPEKVAFHCDKDGRLVAAMLGIPFSFGGFGSEEKVGSLKGMYLCGLATKPEHRGEGLMSTLLQEMNIRAEADGYDFTFLIPADEGLRKFYFDRGYVDAFYRLKYNYSEIHDFKNELFVVNNEDIGDFDNLSGELLSKYNEVSIDKLVQFINESERKDNVVSLIHSAKDIEIAIQENRLNKGDVCVVEDENKLVKGVAFYYITDENYAKIYYILYDNIISKYKLFDVIKSENHSAKISVFESAEVAKNIGQALWKPYYIGSPSNLPNMHSIDTVEIDSDVPSMSKSYAMIRVLNAENVIKFVANLNNFISGDDVENMEKDMRQYERCGIKTLEEFLFRHPHNNYIVYQELNFPRLPLRIGLMLD